MILVLLITSSSTRQRSKQAQHSRLGSGRRNKACDLENPTLPETEMRPRTVNLILLGLVATAVTLSYFSLRRVSQIRSESVEDIDEAPAEEVVPRNRRKQQVLTPEMAALQLVRTTVASNKVAVFSKTYCPYCAKAKAALASVVKPGSVYVVELDQRSDGDAIQDALLEVTGGRSVPRVFVGGKFIGGGDDTAAKAQSGELRQLLVEAGVDVQ